MGLIQEFKEFAVKGNAIDLAVGIVIGAAFTKIVNSIVNDLIMPPIGLLIGGVDFSDLIIPLNTEIVDGEKVVTASIKYGQFINTVIEFLIIAWAVFIVVKLMNRIMRARQAEADAKA
jgi:large conductance mechanosensitive channel